MELLCQQVTKKSTSGKMKAANNKTMREQGVLGNTLMLVAWIRLMLYVYIVKKRHKKTKATMHYCVSQYSLTS